MSREQSFNLGSGSLGMKLQVVQDNGNNTHAVPVFPKQHTEIAGLLI